MAITVDLSPNALEVLGTRYLLRDESGALVETPDDMFRRVAHYVAAAEEAHGGNARRVEARFFEAMASFDFLPNSPALMNAGTALGQLAACFVLPIEDSIESIFSSLRDSALIHQTGGGVGYDFSRIRPQGDRVASTGGRASGPLSFMKVFDASVEAIRQGGRRRGANMGVLHIGHADVERFITAKREGGMLANFNLSVGVSDEFMEAVARGDVWKLANPRDGTVVRTVEAIDLLGLIAECAWESGDPGVIFLDPIERGNPTPELGAITATNPCGEVPLLPYEACMLGSLNLSKFVTASGVDWERLGEVVELAVRFLDDCLDASRFPVARISEAVSANRKIGLGVMGFADALIDAGIQYDSELAEQLAERIIEFISTCATEASRRLARERGPFPTFERSRMAQRGEPPIRNATLTAIAPTGTLSLIAGCSSGIEPLYALAYKRHALEGRTLVEVNPRLERMAEGENWWDRSTRHSVLHNGLISEADRVPGELRRLFRTAREISPEWHIRVQAAFQRHVSNAVSKTINMRPNSSPADVQEAFQLAFRFGCKGVTIYREGSRADQVLMRMAEVEANCPECGEKLSFAEATAHCQACGYSRA